MANRYWVGGAGTWNGTNTTNWSATSGGAGGATVPTNTDDIFFDANSGTGTVSTSTARGFNSITLDNGNSITLSLGSNISGFSNINIRQGVFQSNGFTVTAGNLSTSGTAVRTINLGSSSVTLSLSSAISFMDIANLTFNAGTSTISASSATALIQGGGVTFYNVSLTSATITTAQILGANTFNNLSITGRTTVGIGSVVISSNQTINGTLTLSAGTNATMRTFLRSDIIGTTRTLTCATVSATDADFRDITIAGVATPASGTRLGNCKGNSGITFDAAKTVYWRSATGTNWAAATSSWSLTSGGTATHDAFPLAQDTAAFPAATYPASGATVTLNAAYNIGTIDMSARTTNTMTLAVGSQTPTIYGNWVNGTGITLSGTGTLTFAGRNAQTITSVGKTFTQGITVDSPGGSVTLLDAFVTNRSTSGALTVTQGAFDAVSYNVTLSGSAGTFVSNVSTARTVAIGSGTWTIAASSTTAWNAATSTNLTVTGTGTISLTSSSAKTFIGGDIQTYPTINQGGPGALTITGSNKFSNITNTAIGSVLFTGGTTTDFGAFNLNGISTATRLTVGSTNATQAILKKPTAWNVGTGSLDGGNNTGLSFTAGTNDFLSISGIDGQLSSSSVSVSVPLTGVASTCSVGSVVVNTTSTVTVPLTGVSSTGNIGSVVVNTASILSVTVSLTGISSTCSIGSAVVNTSTSISTQLTGVSSTGSIGSLFINASSIYQLSGVSSSTILGNSLVYLKLTVPISGVESSTFIGNVSIYNVLGILVTPSSLTSIGYTGTLDVYADASTLVTGVYATCIIDSLPVVFLTHIDVLLTSLVSSVVLGNISVSNTNFDYNSVASLYDRTRTIYVDRKSSSKERTVVIDTQSRIVYIDSKSNSSTRRVLAQ